MYNIGKIIDLLNSNLNSIEPPDKVAMKKALEGIDNLTKPIGSLGRLEDIAVKLSGISGKVKNNIKKKNIIVMCADNGVVEEGISCCSQETTAIVTENFTKGITGVCVLAKFYGADITVVDVGIKVDLNNSKIINKKVGYGTKNIAKGPAMTKEEAVICILTGIETVDNLVKDGYDLLGTGEMGIGNTTTSAAVLSVISDLNSDIIVGKGAGLTEKQYSHKKEIVKEAIKVNNPDRNDIIDVISKVGGFDIAALCGCFLGAAKNKVPIVIDGFISSVAALCAYRINPLVKEYIFPSHLSSEPGAAYVNHEIGLIPLLNLNMRLGEGSGCPMAFNIIEASLFVINNMATFKEANLIKEHYVDIR